MKTYEIEEIWLGWMKTNIYLHAVCQWKVWKFWSTFDSAILIFTRYLIMKITEKGAWQIWFVCFFPWIVRVEVRPIVVIGMLKFIVWDKFASVSRKFFKISIKLTSISLRSRKRKKHINKIRQSMTSPNWTFRSITISIDFKPRMNHLKIV